MTSDNLAEIMAEIEQNPGTEPLMPGELRARWGVLKDAAARPAQRQESHMSDERLTDMDLAFYEDIGARWTEWKRGPILARRGFVSLTAEIRRLRRENQLLKLSQGDMGAVGQD